MAFRQRVSNPVVGRNRRGAFPGSVQPALESEVVALRGGGIDVHPVDAHGRGSYEAHALGVVDRFDAPKLDLGTRGALGDEPTQPRQQPLVARAAVEVEKLDPHFPDQRLTRR